jgi:hypothetical protein
MQRRNIWELVHQAAALPGSPSSPLVLTNPLEMRARRRRRRMLGEFVFRRK